MDASRIPDLWVNTDATLAFEDPTLAELLRYWQAKRGNRSMPARRDIAPYELKAHIGNICLIDVEHAPLRLRYRLIGTRIVQVIGRDSTGKYYDEIYAPALLRGILASFEWIVAHRKPLRSFGQAFYPDRNFYEYEIVNLPLSDDDSVVNMVLGKLVFHRAARRREPGDNGASSNPD